MGTTKDQYRETAAAPPATTSNPAAGSLAGAPESSLPRTVEESPSDLPVQGPAAAAAEIAVDETPSDGGARPPGFIRQFELVDLVKKYDPKADEDLLNRAYVFAMVAHGDQKRSSGDPYFSHPLAVAAICTELKLDPVTVATALLHDVVEDTDKSNADIRQHFGDEVARLVDGVTKISKRELAPDADGRAENFLKFIMATAKDVRVLLVKLADRLHNMRTLHFIKKPEKRERIARETMEIFAPLAGRIGVQKIKEELEDLSFRYINPGAYDAIASRLEHLASDVVSDVVALSQTLREALEAEGLATEIHSREKRAFSIWRKMQRKRMTFDELADIYAFRVIVNETADCYRALGVIHRAFPMIPGEFDDYISTPKPNGYRSVHTAVVAPGREKRGQRVEVQIRSRRMHEVAERGIAAHWRYKEASATTNTGDTVEMTGDGIHGTYDWLQGVVSLLNSPEGASTFLDHAKIDLYKNQVFPFTPKGRVIPLPEGATALDFAYMLHTEVGDQFAGAKINGVQRPARTPLRNGDVVEVLRGNTPPIPTGWESFVVTAGAKTGLRRRIRALQKQEHESLGERIVQAAFAARDLPLSDKALTEAAEKLGHESRIALLQAVGRMDLTGVEVLETVFPNLDVGPDADPQRTFEVGGVVPPSIVSLAGVRPGGALRLATCCSPLPGERVVGLRQAGEGIVAHRIDCPQLIAAEDEDWIDLTWGEAEGARFVAPIVLTVNNRTGALGHIGSMLAKYDCDIVDLKLNHREVHFSELWFDIAVRDARHFHNVLTALRASDYVVSSERRERSSALPINEVPT